MKIFIAGGAGYIGSHVAKYLKEKNHEITIYDNLSTGHLWACPDGLIEADLEDTAALIKALETIKPDVVIHLASLINVRDSIIDPALYYEKNLLSSLSLLKAMVQTGVKKLIFSSTAAIYGTPEKLPLDENHPKAPLNAYGKTKLAIEGMLQDFFHAHGLQFVSLRYFNAAGADLSKTIGEAHHPETHLIPLAIRAAMTEKPLNIYGNDYPTPDGSAIRDYIHVLDLARAHLLSIDYLFQKKGFLELNLGTGKGYSVFEVIQEIEKYSQKKVPFQILPRFSQDAALLVANPQKAKEMLGFSTKYSSLSKIVQTAWDWEEKFYLKSLKLFSPTSTVPPS